MRHAVRAVTVSNAARSGSSNRDPDAVLPLRVWFGGRLGGVWVADPPFADVAFRELSIGALAAIESPNRNEQALVVRDARGNRSVVARDPRGDTPSRASSRAVPASGIFASGYRSDRSRQQQAASAHLQQAQALTVAIGRFAGPPLSRELARSLAPLSRRGRGRAEWLPITGQTPPCTARREPPSVTTGVPHCTLSVTADRPAAALLHLPHPTISQTAEAPARLSLTLLTPSVRLDQSDSSDPSG